MERKSSRVNECDDGVGCWRLKVYVMERKSSRVNEGDDGVGCWRLRDKTLAGVRVRVR